jgi:hypothetical protein
MRYWGREYRSGAGTGRECLSGFCRGFVRYATSEWDESTGRPSQFRDNVNRYFIEAPDNGLKPSNAEGAYQDASACHCILFDENGNVTKQVDEHIWLVTFMHYDLGYFDDETCRLEPIDNPFGPNLLPMSPE